MHREEGGAWGANKSQQKPEKMNNEASTVSSQYKRLPRKSKQFECLSKEEGDRRDEAGGGNSYVRSFPSEDTQRPYRSIVSVSRLQELYS